VPKGKELSIDSTQVNANADLDSLTPRFAMEARAAVQAHLTALFAEEESQPEETEVVASLPEGTSSEVRTSTVPLALPVVLPQAEQEELASENVVKFYALLQGKISNACSKTRMRRHPFPVEALCASFLAAFGWFARPSSRYVSVSSLIGSHGPVNKIQHLPSY